MNERIPELAASCLFLLPSFLWCRVLNDDGPFPHLPSHHQRIYGLHAPVVKLVCSILLPQACECLDLCVYISRATVWKLGEQTDREEFTGQAATASLLWRTCFISVYSILGFLCSFCFSNPHGFGYMFSSGFVSLRNPHEEVFTWSDGWVKFAWQGTSRTFP